MNEYRITKRTARTERGSCGALGWAGSNQSERGKPDSTAMRFMTVLRQRHIINTVSARIACRAIKSIPAKWLVVLYGNKKYVTYRTGSVNNVLKGRISSCVLHESELFLFILYFVSYSNIGEGGIIRTP